MCSLRVVVFISTFVSAISSDASGATLRVGDVVATSGESLDVSVTLGGGEGIGALDAQISFDPKALIFIEAKVGGVAGNGMLRSNEVEPGRLRIALIDGDGFSGDGELLSIKLRALEGAHTSAQLVVEQISAHHAVKLIAIPIDTENGTVTFKAPSAEPVPVESEDVSAPVQVSETWLWIPVIAFVLLVGFLLGRRKPPT